MKFKMMAIVFLQLLVQAGGLRAEDLSEAYSALAKKVIEFANEQNHFLDLEAEFQELERKRSMLFKEAFKLTTRASKEVLVFSQNLPKEVLEFEWMADEYLSRAPQFKDRAFMRMGKMMLPLYLSRKLPGQSPERITTRWLIKAGISAIPLLIFGTYAGAPSNLNFVALGLGGIVLAQSLVAAAIALDAQFEMPQAREDFQGLSKLAQLGRQNFWNQLEAEGYPNPFKVEGFDPSMRTQKLFLKSLLNGKLDSLLINEAPFKGKFLDLLSRQLGKITIEDSLYIHLHHEIEQIQNFRGSAASLYESVVHEMLLGRLPANLIPTKFKFWTNALKDARAGGLKFLEEAYSKLVAIVVDHLTKSLEEQIGRRSVSPESKKRAAQILEMYQAIEEERDKIFDDTLKDASFEFAQKYFWKKIKDAGLEVPADRPDYASVSRPLQRRIDLDYFKSYILVESGERVSTQTCKEALAIFKENKK